ncbi:MAG: citryl-CoA lyase [Candidatus Magasanikbacteria bacterium CG10_big_fil_rev_8_21_14_0_10_47_10]|uniref:citrate synthase (unknown stereospecificity) n=1 Tax=Candidatus Magasanikbacteria bacterium CG10_big_fil_rev_8_21_14_0_10_47_10 TaxID=1974652 RepID=A0A2H0TR95_9BACT|nr:MAG: citryl-CoA lyase [Candidatus Magasanikbacteria bacterium CG10_big_fil_rev_8_21_14_0_10_47_10]
MKFKTSITDVKKDGSEVMRGEKLTDLIKEKTFAEVIYFILKGQMPDESQLTMFNAILTSVIDHGPATASAMNARISASAKNDMHVALAAGILGFGPRHGVAVESAMQFLMKNKENKNVSQTLQEMKERKEYVPGYGHKVFDTDPRATALFALAKETGIAGDYCALAEAVRSALNESSSKSLPINVDGAIAAILCDIGFDAALGSGIFLIGRVPGLVAHIHEEMTNDTGIRRLDSTEVEYKNA